MQCAGNVSRLGHRTAFIGKVGNDFFGKQLEDAITEVGIDAAGLLKDEDSKVLSKIVLYLIIPCVILNAFSGRLHAGNGAGAAGCVCGFASDAGCASFCGFSSWTGVSFGCG